MNASGWQFNDRTYSDSKERIGKCVGAAQLVPRRISHFRLAWPRHLVRRFDFILAPLYWPTMRIPIPKSAIIEQLKGF